MATTLHPDRARRDQGFTLVEILIAIVLVGILSAVVVVGVSNLTSKGSQSACNASLDASKAATVVFYANSVSYPTTFDAMLDLDPPALTLPSDVTRTPLTITGSGWTLTMTPGARNRTPTFACS